MKKPSQTVYMHSDETGYRYRRYPESKHRNGRVYWVRTKAGGGARYFHVDLWEKHNGPVPSGYHIHHRDHDPLNNDLANLECIAPKAHAEHHMGNLSDDRLEQIRANLDRIRDSARAWHASEDGREWHSLNAKQMWEGKTAAPRNCDSCGAEYETRGIRVRFCSNACKSKWRRSQRTDWITVPCKGCGKERELNRFQLRDYCLPCARWPQRRVLEQSA